MPSITKLASGNWRAQVRRKGSYVADTFRRRKDAEEWALNTERCIDQGITPKQRPNGPAKTFGDLIDLHMHDLYEAGKRALAQQLGGEPTPAFPATRRGHGALQGH